MKEYKFRAWDKLTKKMRTDDGVIWNLGLIVSRPKDFEVMQFTGLLDKAGKEIYEGDIFEVKTNKIVFFIFWCDKEAMWYFKYYSKRNDKIVSGERPFHKQAAEFNEVIGNIWQNPKLLKVIA